MVSCLVFLWCICTLLYSTTSLPTGRLSSETCSCHLESGNSSLSCQMNSSTISREAGQSRVPCVIIGSLAKIGDTGRPLKVNSINPTALDPFRRVTSLNWELEGMSFSSSTPSPLTNLTKVETLIISAPQSALDSCVFAKMNSLRRLLIHCQTDFPISISLPATIERVSLTHCSNQNLQMSCDRCEQYPHLRIFRVEEGPPLESNLLNRDEQECSDSYCSIDELCGLDIVIPSSTSFTSTVTPAQTFSTTPVTNTTHDLITSSSIGQDPAMQTTEMASSISTSIKTTENNAMTSSSSLQTVREHDVVTYSHFPTHTYRSTEPITVGQSTMIQIPTEQAPVATSTLLTSSSSRPGYIEKQDSTTPLHTSPKKVSTDTTTQVASTVAILTDEYSSSKTSSAATHSATDKQFASSHSKVFSSTLKYDKVDATTPYPSNSISIDSSDTANFHEVSSSIESETEPERSQTVTVKMVTSKTSKLTEVATPSTSNCIRPAEGRKEQGQLKEPENPWLGVAIFFIITTIVLAIILLLMCFDVIPWRRRSSHTGNGKVSQQYNGTKNEEGVPLNKIDSSAASDS